MPFTDSSLSNEESGEGIVKKIRFRRTHNAPQCSDKANLHNLFLQQTYAADPEILKEIEKIVVPKRKPTRPIPQSVQKLLKKNIPLPQFDENDREVMALNALLDQEIAEIEIINFDDEDIETGQEIGEVREGQNGFRMSDFPRRTECGRILADSSSNVDTASTSQMDTDEVQSEMLFQLNELASRE